MGLGWKKGTEEQDKSVGRDRHRLNVHGSWKVQNSQALESKMILCDGAAVFFV